MKRIELALCIVGALLVALVVLSEAKSLPKEEEKKAAEAEGETRKSLKKAGGKFDPADADDASDYLDGEEELIKTTTNKPASRSGLTAKTTGKSAKKSSKKRKTTKTPTTAKPEEEEEDEGEEDEADDLDEGADGAESEDSGEPEGEIEHRGGWTEGWSERKWTPRPVPFAGKKYVPRPPRVIG